MNESERAFERRELRMRMKEGGGKGEEGKWRGKEIE